MIQELRDFFVGSPPVQAFLKLVYIAAAALVIQTMLLTYITFKL